MQVSNAAILAISTVVAVVATAAWIGWIVYSGLNKADKT